MTGYEQTAAVPGAGRRFRAYTAKHLDALAERAGLGAGERLAVRAVATVLPFRTNSYVVECLIDWDAAPDDPIYRLVFPQPDMLPESDVARLAGMLNGGAPDSVLRAAAHAVRMRLNPHPAASSRSTSRNWPTSQSLESSTNTPKRFSCSPSRVKPVMRTAPTVSGGRSSSMSPA